VTSILTSLFHLEEKSYREIVKVDFIRIYISLDKRETLF
jgi:hypothetical protein